MICSRLDGMTLPWPRVISSRLKNAAQISAISKVNPVAHTRILLARRSSSSTVAMPNPELCILFLLMLLPLGPWAR